MTSILDKVSGGEKWKACKYSINISLKFEDGTVRKLHTTQILSLYIEKDFDTDHLPIMMVDLALSTIDQNLVNSKTEFQVQIKQFYIEESEGEKKSQKYFLNDTFVKMDYGKSPDSAAKINKDIRKEEYLSDDDVAPVDLTNKVSYTLYKKSDLALTKTIVNGNLSNVTQLKILAWMIQKSGCRKRFLLSNFTNSKEVKEIMVHPKGFLESMIETEKEYGWHTEGTYIFFDYDLLYIIRMNGKCTAWQQNEPKTLCFCITSSTSSDNIPTGVLPKNDTIYYNIGGDQYKTSVSTDINEHIEGSNVILVNTSDGSTSNVSGGSSGGSYQAKSYHGHNPYVSEQHKRRQSELANQVTLVCMNGDIGYLTPNKAVKILTDMTENVSKFNGDFRLAEIKVSFGKNGEFFDNAARIVLKKVSN